MFVRKGVVPKHIREIVLDQEMSDIWRRLPHEMMLLMHHVVDALNLIHILKDRSQPMPSSEDDAHGPSHHDYPPPSSLLDRPTSPHSPPHASLVAPSIDPPPLSLPPPLDPLMSVATPSIDPLHPYPIVSISTPSINPPPPPPHLSLVASSTNPPPPPNMGIGKPSISSSEGICSSSSGGRTS
jgi:hypothetical protein